MESDEEKESKQRRNTHTINDYFARQHSSWEREWEKDKEDKGGIVGVRGTDGRLESRRCNNAENKRKKQTARGFSGICPPLCFSHRAIWLGCWSRAVKRQPFWGRMAGLKETAHKWRGLTLGSECDLWGRRLLHSARLVNYDRTTLLSQADL